MKILVKFILFLKLLSASLFCISQSSAAADSVLLDLIKPKAVYNDDFVRKTFYTWTTPDQIEELRKGKTLLSKSSSETRGYSLFDSAIRDTIFKSFLIARLLQQPQFAKKRFAWTSAWATALGVEKESYGNQLIKIVLSDDAIIGSFNPDYLPDPFQFYDMKGNKLKADYVIENSDRLAVMYHINKMELIRTEEARKRKSTHYYYTGKFKKEKVTVPLREFVIINKNMIHWSYGTEEIKNEISAEIEFLQKLQSFPRCNQRGYRYDCSPVKEQASSDYECKYTALRCFSDDHYLFNKKQLQAIIDTLNLALKQQSAPIIN